MRAEIDRSYFWGEEIIPGIFVKQVARDYCKVTHVEDNKTKCEFYADYMLGKHADDKEDMLVLCRKQNKVHFDVFSSKKGKLNSDTAIGLECTLENGGLAVFYYSEQGFYLK